MEAYKELYITPVFNSTYAPAYNPIEQVFSKVKRVFKERRLNKIVNNVKVNEQELIRWSFNQIDKNHILHAINSSMTLLGVVQKEEDPDLARSPLLQLEEA